MEREPRSPSPATPSQGRRPSRPLVEIAGVRHIYHSLDGETLALDGIDFAVEEGEFVSIVGPSGCGKSTLLSLIAGLMRPTAGTVLVQGEPARPGSPAIGYMLQHDHLFEWRTILDNCLLGLEVRRSLTPAAQERVMRLLAECGLEGFARRYPDELSGGMRQRAALVRTLALDPKLLLLDEPFGALDYQTRLRLEDEVGKILKAAGKTAILVTHDIAEAISMSDRVVVMSARPGRIRRVVPIRLGEYDGPLDARRSPRFAEYFDLIWKELGV